MNVLPEDLVIASAQGDYPVEFSSTIEQALEAVASIPDAFYLVDRNLLGLYPQLKNLLDGRRHLELDANEDEKTLAGVTKVVHWLQRNNCSKKSTVVAIGGGIIQDLATFSSHVYYRGVPWAFVPTTLLSMSDSCIGAKCGINVNEFKNQLGVFQSPARVLIATDFITTLADQDVASGYGEILKLLLTGPPDGFAKLREIVERDGLRTQHLPELVHASLKVKKQVIEEDEYEADYRRVLNYGHTFGHALESLTSHEVPHGLGVAWGIDLVNYIAVARGLLEKAIFDEVHDFIRRHIPFRLSRPVATGELIAASRRDKKASGGEVNLVLLARHGELRIVKVPFDGDLERQVSEYLERHDAFRGH
jgi:3-dehydroquinate synthase